MPELKISEKGISIREGGGISGLHGFFHLFTARWTQWQTVRSGEITNRVFTGYVKAHFKDEERRCTVCGKLEAREVRV